MSKSYTNISSATTTTLVTKDGTRSGAVNKISIVNTSTHVDGAGVLLFLDNEAGVNYILCETKIPSLTTLVLTDHLSFDSSVYSLKLTTTGHISLTVIFR